MSNIDLTDPRTWAGTLYTGVPLRPLPARTQVILQHEGAWYGALVEGDGQAHRWYGPYARESSAKGQVTRATRRARREGRL